MYARLWWKEARVFWPIWVALGVIAAGVQWFLLWNQVPEARAGLLIVLGLCWSTLYAFAVGAGGFAGERESKTQVFLDTMPVSRRMQWRGKVSFALATTLGLTLALTALGALGTAELNPREYPPEILLHGFSLVLFEAVAWSLLWSVVLGSSLQAALTGIVTVGMIGALLSEKTKLHALDMLAPALAPYVLRLVLAGAALGFSWLVFTRGARDDRSGWVRLMLAQPGPQFQRLVWETVRESRRLWLLLAGAWVGLPLATGFLFHRTGFLFHRADSGLWVVFGVLTCGVTAGVGVFATANRAQSYQFLAYHGVRPGVVWGARLLVWGAFITGMLSVAAVVAGLTIEWSPKKTGDELTAGFVIFEAFVVGVLAGQVLRRGITAWVVTMLAFALLVMPQSALYAGSLIPVASLALFPLLVLMISWAWTGDWMNDLRGAARWLRLGGMIGAAAALLIALYIGYRALSVPDIGSPFPPRLAEVPAVGLSPGQDAAPDYTRLLVDSLAIAVPTSDPAHGDGFLNVPDAAMLARIATNGWHPELQLGVAWWEARRGLIERIRRAAAKPEARFPQSGSGPAPPSRRLADMHSLLVLLGLDNFERRSRDDLTGAWDDLRAAFQMADQLARAGSYDETSFALTWRTQTLQWALAWAGDSQQTPAQLRAALTDVRVLLRPVSATAGLEDGYTRNARLIRHYPDALIDPEGGGSATSRLVQRLLIAPWWERVRALRVLRLMTARQLRLAELEPWQRLLPWKHNDVATAGNTTLRDWNTILWDLDLDEYRASTPLARSLPTNDARLSSHDKNLLLSRAFEQVAALRIWQLEHGGHYPSTLEALVPGLLPSLPPDPYSGKPFRYLRSDGRVFLAREMGGRVDPAQNRRLQFQPTQVGQWFLYSVGPNRIDDALPADYESNPDRGDHVFSLPPAGS